MNETANIKVFRTINDIERDAIDSLVNDGFFTYGWFKTLETTKHINLNPFYLTAFSNGKLVGFVPCFLDVDDQFFRSTSRGGLISKKLLEIYKRFRLGQDHVLLCYSPYCYRTKIFLDKNQDKGLMIKKLAKEINSICKKEKILLSSFLFVSQFDQDSSTYLGNNGYHKFLRKNVSYYLPLHWQSFEEYLSSLEYDARKTARREIRKSEENGITIESLTEFKGLSTMLSQLSSNLLSKYHKQTTNYYSSSFYERLNDCFAKGNARVFIARKQNQILGFSLFLRHGETADGVRCGFNYELQRKNDFTYFNLAYYAPIRWAIQQGIKKIYYRYTMDKVKIRRGCKPEQSFTFIKCHNKQINSLVGSLQKLRTMYKKRANV
jgi:predicted N-acyltransferase